MTFNQMLDKESLKDEWQYLVNNSEMSRNPRNCWEQIFNKRKTDRPEIRTDKFLEALQRLSQRIEQGEDVRENVYPNDMLDQGRNNVVIYKYLLKDRSPLAIICPGGGYRFVSMFNEGLPMAEELNKRGISAVILNYRTDNWARYPNPMLDLAYTIAKFRSNADLYNVIPDSISLFGSSSAGHLCSYFGAKYADFSSNLRPNALVLSYPVTRFVGEGTHLGSVTRMLGDSPTKQQLHDFTVSNLVTSNYPPTFVWHCLNDTSVPVINSQCLVEQLQAHNVKHEFVTFPNGGHGLGCAFGMEQYSWIDKAVDFLKSI